MYILPQNCPYIKIKRNLFIVIKVITPIFEWPSPYLNVTGLPGLTPYSEVYGTVVASRNATAPLGSCPGACSTAARYFSDSDYFG